MKNLIIAILVIALGGLGWYAYSNQQPAMQDASADAGMGTYAYECDEHVAFEMTPASDMSSIRIKASGNGAYPPETTLLRKADNRYEGTSVVLVGNGETVTLNPEEDGAINCSPVPNPDMAPWNWGDAGEEMSGGEAGSVKQDTTLIVTENLVGKWQANDDKKFVREFKEGDVVVDWYDNEVKTQGHFVVFTKVNAPKQVAFPIDANAVYIQMTETGSQSDTLNFRVGLSADANTLTLTYMDRGGVTTYTRIK